MQKNLNELLEKSLYVHKELKAKEEDGANYRWINKKVYDSLVIYDGSSLDKVEKSACTSLSIDHEVYLTNASSLKMTASTDIENVIPRPWPSIHIKLDHLDLSKYNRIACDIYIKATGYQNFYYQFFVGNKGERDHHSPSLIPNRWNHVIWEIDDVLRDDCEEFIIGPWLMGCPPEGLPLYEVYIDQIKAEIVDPDYVKGWDIGEKIAYSHVGYFIDQEKQAIVKNVSSPSFRLYNNNELVLEKSLEKVSTKIGEFYLIDFTEIKKEGIYKIKVGDIVTKEFSISNHCYDESIWKSMNFLRLLRCGEDIPGVHSACHLNCRTVNDDGSSVPNFGGWHDAGDVSQFEIPTAEMAHAIIDLAKKVKDKDHMMYERLKEEARVGLNWLLRTRFGNGMRALAVGYSIWRHNVLTKDNNTVLANKAENGPFENFCSAAALAAAYDLYKDEDEIFASWCKRSAMEDFDFAVDGYNKKIHTVRWGSNVDSQVCGHGALAACEIYKITNDKKYLDIAVSYAKTILLCQEQNYLPGDIKIRGFFYEDVAHKYILTYEHRGHEQSPIQGLCSLCEVAKNHPDYPTWIKGLELYREYVLSTMKYTAPYNLVPGHVYILDKINEERFTIPKDYGTIEEGMEILRNQIKNGIKINDTTYLRIFPIAVQRRGFHATLLSKTKAVSLIAKTLNDEKLRQIAHDQLAWVLGKNPFASSTMYGEGYNYHPLYVAFSRQMVGALPVGIMTKGDEDLPFWPTRTHAVYKEIWGHTTGKYLWVLADLL